MKDKIITTTKQQIRLKGLSFTMDDLVIQLGISKKTIYQYFTGKEALIEEIIHEMTLDMKRQQLELFNDTSIPPVAKLKQLIKILPTQYDLITPITFHQLQRSFPKLYTMMNNIYHNDWTRFDQLYKECVEKELIEPFDIAFFKELYIVAITKLPEIPSLSKYNQKELVSKTVDQLFMGIGGPQ